MIQEYWYFLRLKLYCDGSQVVPIQISLRRRPTVFVALTVFVICWDFGQWHINHLRNLLQECQPNRTYVTSQLIFYNQPCAYFSLISHRLCCCWNQLTVNIRTASTLGTWKQNCLLLYICKVQRLHQSASDTNRDRWHLGTPYLYSVEIWFLSRLLRISWTDKKSNVEVITGLTAAEQVCSES